MLLHQIVPIERDAGEGDTKRTVYKAPETGETCLRRIVGMGGDTGKNRAKIRARKGYPLLAGAVVVSETRYLDDGRLELSNNRAERSMKPFMMGWKNWLFANTPASTQSSAVIYSLIEPAKGTICIHSDICLGFCEVHRH